MARGFELRSFLTVSEAAQRVAFGSKEETKVENYVRTNIAFGARAFVPTNASLVLLSGTTNSRGKIVGARISPALLPKK
jgi:hypothetical protein